MKTSKCILLCHHHCISLYYILHFFRGYKRRIKNKSKFVYFICFLCLPTLQHAQSMWLAPTIRLHVTQPANLDISSNVTYHSDCTPSNFPHFSYNGTIKEQSTMVSFHSCSQPNLVRKGFCIVVLSMNPVSAYFYCNTNLVLEKIFNDEILNSSMLSSQNIV